jgi:hypothetical protein
VTSVQIITDPSASRNHFRRPPSVLGVLDLPGSQRRLAGDLHESSPDLLLQLGQSPMKKAAGVQAPASVGEQLAIVERLADQTRKLQPSLDRKIPVAHAASVVRKSRSTHATDLVHRSIADRAAFLATPPLAFSLAMLQRKRRVHSLPCRRLNVKMTLRLKTRSFPCA